MTARALTLVIALGAVVACKGDRKRAPSGSGSGSGSGKAAKGPTQKDLDWCLTKLERAAGLAPLERAGEIVRGCSLCSGVSFDPIIAGDHAVDGGPVDLPALLGVIETCGGVCSRSAATGLHETLADLGKDHPTIRPWRSLAEACPSTMHADRDAARFASGAWYVLATIGDKLATARPSMTADQQARLDAATAHLVLPLPARSATGNPLLLATGASQRPTPWLAISIVGDQLFLGPLPFVHLRADGLRLIGAPVYPGDVVLASALGLAISTAVERGPGFDVPAPGRLERPVILAPYGSPAARVLDVVRAAGDDPTYLAVNSAAPASMWPGQLAAHPVPMATRDPIRAAHLRISLSSARVAAVDLAGKVVASADLPSPDQPAAARLYAAAAAMAPGGVVEIVAETGTVADLTAVLDAALRGGAAGVIPARAADVTSRPRPTFDATALRALVTPP